MEGSTYRGLRQRRAVKQSVVHGVVACDQMLLQLFAEQSVFGFQAVRNITYATISTAILIRAHQFIIRLDNGVAELEIVLDF
ncbi:hypothetical protein [Lysobacter sp. CA199]|uniref:hypothetical protein n=1 Tax=Lysobacter sp. CA199 TaxID=3455608 RepID=UPI003F8D1C64